jgi:hypothetical protein
MKPNYTCPALLLCLGLLAFPAHAIVTCTRTEAAATSPGSAAGKEDVVQIARRLAGVEPPGESSGPAYGQYVIAVNDGWQAYTQSFGRPLTAWATRELPKDAGRTVLYPFSGPDLPSVLAIYPGASRVVMISDQYATKPFDPFALKEAEQARIVPQLGESWARFGRLGFFLTQELNKAGQQKYYVSPSMVLMAFAVRLGYEVRSLSPTCVDANDLSIRPVESKSARWGSVRLELRKDGRDLIVDYVQQDLSNQGLRKHPETRALIESLAKGPVLLKAASHLPQQAGFSVVRNAVLASTPLLVQDETGLEYDAMAKSFNVKLYGVYVGAYRLFKEATNASLVRAYQERAQDVRPLDFKLGYDKDAGSAIQVGTRK